jgi:iron-sulfur cluster repair protein YtfE (RIC family)
MKDLTPIKRHPAMVSFSKDHHFGLLLVWKIRQGLKKSIEAGRIGKYVLFFFSEDLLKHFWDEEKLLFSRLRADDLLRIQAEEDHAVIYQLIKDIRNQTEDTGLLTQLADRLEKHIRFEERELFNHLQSVIGADELALIEKRIGNDSKEIDEKWDDIFWI